MSYERFEHEEGQCECQVDPGEFCTGAATQVIAEPFTPLSSTFRCCDEHAAEYVSNGYHRRAA